MHIEHSLSSSMETANDVPQCLMSNKSKEEHRVFGSTKQNVEFLNAAVS